MKLLAIDTSTEKASVALKVNNQIRCAEQDSPKTHAQCILPMIESLLTGAETSLSQLDAVIFGRGPGSFTGLRIACSIAKGLGYAHNLSLIPVSTLAAIAWSARARENDNQLPVLSVMDARMHQLYWAYYPPNEFEASEFVSSAQDILVMDQRSFCLAGVGIDLYWSELPDALTTKISQKLAVFPNASAMIHLAEHLSLEPISVDKAQPVYIRNQVTQGDTRG